MPRKGAGVQGLLVHSRGQQTPLLLVPSFSNDHILRQEQCYVQMQQPLVEMHQTLDLVLIESLRLCVHMHMSLCKCLECFILRGNCVLPVEQSSHSIVKFDRL